MSVSTSRTRTAVLLTAATLTGLVVGGGGATAAPTATADDAAAAGDVSADSSTLPPELTRYTRLFVNPYRSYLVQIVDGHPTLVLSTGWDSCVFMTQDGLQRYPC